MKISSKNSKSIKTNVYVEVEKNLPIHKMEYKKVIEKFINDNNASIFATIPVDRIYYTEDDANQMFKALDISKKTINNAMLNTYYGDEPKAAPKAARDELTLLMLCAIRYFLLKNDTKNLEISMVYLALSGKFYPSVHFMSFQKFLPKDYIMEYVVNNMLNKKFVLKSTGNLFNALMSMCKTWVETYKKKFKTFDDEDVVYLISQLHSRIRSFMINIARAYYSAYENKDYITFNSDNEDPEANGGSYHLADSDSFKAEKAIQKSMSSIITSGADYRICKIASNKSIKTEELKSIIESILNNKENYILVKRLISILIYTYFENNTDKNVVSMKFVTYSITPKPNTKDPHIIELKTIVNDWLEDNSVRYRKRKHRLATKNDYNKAIIMFFAFLIYGANK